MQNSSAYEMIIGNINQVVKMEKHEAENFISLLKKNTFRRKEFVHLSGEVCRYETFVTSGCLKIFYSDPDGIEHNVKFAPENWWAIDLESFAMQTPAFYSIQAVEDTTCFQISKADHDKLYDKIPKLEKFARVRYQQAYLLLQQRMTQNLYSTAEQKYDAFTKKYPGLELRVPQKDIASYLGITPEFLSMLRKKRMKSIIS